MNQKIVNALSAMAILSAPSPLVSAFGQAGKSANIDFSESLGENVAFLHRYRNSVAPAVTNRRSQGPAGMKSRGKRDAA